MKSRGTNLPPEVYELSLNAVLSHKLFEEGKFRITRLEEPVAESLERNFPDMIPQIHRANIVGWVEAEFLVRSRFEILLLRTKFQ